MIGCHNFQCKQHGEAGEIFDPSKHCRKCFGAARDEKLAKSLNRPVLFPPSPCSCGGCPGCAEPPPAAVPVADALAASATDKHREHGYAPMYADITAGRPIRAVLEIGVLSGGSIRAWAAAWPDAEIVAADIDPAAAARIADVSQARFVRLDVSDTAALIRFGRENRNRFDLVIDDSTHKAAHQVAIRRHLYQAIRPGGVMVIEDVPNDAAAKCLRGRVWDFRDVGRWDSRCVAVERPTTPRVLFSGNYLARDGAPILLANLARHLRGWSVTVHSPHDGPLRSTLEEAGIPVIVGDLPQAAVADADLIVGNTLLAHGAIRRARDFTLPCVWLIHESDPAMCGAEVERQVREVIGYPARVVFPCRATAEAYHGMPEHRAAIIPTVIPPVPARDRRECRKRLGIPDAAFAVVTMGRDEPRKGHQDIRSALTHFYGWPFYVADAGDPWSYYAAADVYVCSSRIEAFPLAIQEAKAYGVPVITTPVFGCAEIIRDGIDGLHYQPGGRAGPPREDRTHPHRSGATCPALEAADAPAELRRDAAAVRGSIRRGRGGEAMGFVEIARLAKALGRGAPPDYPVNWCRRRGSRRGHGEAAGEEP